MANKPPKSTKSDVIHSVIKGSLGSIPILGSFASEIFGQLVTPQLEKRRIKWMNEIAEELNKLSEHHKIDFEELKTDGQFLDVILQATTHALKTSEREKIEAFKNVVLNTAQGECPDNTITQIFLNTINDFTIWHIKILIFIDNPTQWFKNAQLNPPSYMMSSLSTIIKEAFPDLKEQDELLDILWNDLRLSGFHRTSEINTTMSGSGLLSSRTTQLGKQFIAFISSETLE